MDHKTVQNLENQYCHEHQLLFWPFPVDQAMITHILAHYSGTKWWMISPGQLFAHDRCSTKDQKTAQHLENRLCHIGKPMFWPFILNQTMSTDSSHCRLTPPGHLFTHESWATRKQKTPQYLKNGFVIKAGQCSGHLYWIKPVLTGSMVDWYSGGASQDCMPLQWAQKVCIHGVIQ